MSVTHKRKEPDDPDGDIGHDSKKQKKNVDPNNDVRIRIDRHLHKILTNLRNYYGLDNKSAIKNVILMVLHDAGFRYNTDGEVWKNVQQSAEVPRAYNMPVNQPQMAPNVHNTFFSGSNHSQVALPNQFISPNNQNTVFVNSNNIPKPDHILPSFAPVSGAHQPIYILPQFGSAPQLPFYGQSQPQLPPQAMTNDIDYLQHMHFHQSFAAPKPPSTNPNNSTNGKSPVDLEDEKNGTKQHKSNIHNLTSTSDVNSAASTLLNFDSKSSSETKKDVMSIESLSAPLVTTSPKTDDTSSKPSALPSITSAVPFRIGSIQTLVSPSQWRRYNSKFSNFAVSVPAEWTEPKEVLGSLHSIGDYSGSVVLLNVRYKQNDRKADPDHHMHELLGQLQKEIPTLEDLAVNNAILNGYKTKSITYNVMENINMQAKPMKYRHVQLLSDASVYTITLACVLEHEKRLIETFESILNNFRLYSE
jgi:hypothetical protein